MTLTRSRSSQTPCASTLTSSCDQVHRLGALAYFRFVSSAYPGKWHARTLRGRRQKRSVGTPPNRPRGHCVFLNELKLNHWL
eukprot:6178652-Pleurochrysis_carterae.AAC.7